MVSVYRKLANLEVGTGRLRLHYLPTYAPELNPDERLWSDVKHHGINRLDFTSAVGLWWLIQRHLANLEKLPEKIKSFFGGKPREYIAESGFLMTS